MAAWALLRQSSEEVSGRDSRIMATAAPVSCRMLRAWAVDVSGRGSRKQRITAKEEMETMMK